MDIDLRKPIEVLAVVRANVGNLVGQCDGDDFEVVDPVAPWLVPLHQVLEDGQAGRGWAKDGAVGLCAEVELPDLGEWFVHF